MTPANAKLGRGKSPRSTTRPDAVKRLAGCSALAPFFSLPWKKKWRRDAQKKANKLEDSSARVWIRSWRGVFSLRYLVFLRLLWTLCEVGSSKMVERRKRMASGKGKRWAKRGSSSSNPQTNRHRLAAKNKFSGFESVPVSGARSALTTEALAQHEGLESDDDEMDDGSSVSEESEFFCGSFEGTVFARVGQKWNSPQASHREVRWIFSQFWPVSLVHEVQSISVLDLFLTGVRCPGRN